MNAPGRRSPSVLAKASFASSAAWPCQGFVIAALAVLTCLPGVGGAAGLDAASNTDLRGRGISLIPRPARVELGQGRFTLTAKTTIHTGLGTEPWGRYLANAFAPALGFRLPVVAGVSGSGQPGAIELLLAADAGRRGDEGYTLDVLPDRILIQAAKPAGLFYGCQTLRQLFPPQIGSRTRVEGVAWSAPVARIEDQPQFVWRGVLLDPARHFISKQGIFHCLDWMAYHKLNRLHLHLTDTDGWRVQIKKYPRLTEVGAWADLGEGNKVGGFYTQVDIREMVAYANERFVTIVPEIETPSHAGAAMVAYPELNCFGARQTAVAFGIDPLCGSEYCPGKDRVFDFLDDVFTEVAQLFPGPYLHVGGDEAEMRFWADCPLCQARQKQVGNLHAWFMGRVRRIVESKGKRVVGWGGVASGAVFTCWDADGSGGWGAARQGWDVVMSPGNHLYINYNIERTTLKTTYDFDPAPPSAALTPDARRHILGVEACLWGEMAPENHLDRQAFPRVLAVAERGWGIERSDFDDFLERVKVHVGRLAALDVVTGPAFPYPVLPALPARVRNALPALIYSPSQNQNDEDWRWALTGIDPGQGRDALQPMQAFDGDLETYYLTWGPRKDVDTFTVVLAEPRVFDAVKAITGLANGNHILRQGVLEVSTGYGRWKVVAPFKRGVAEAKLGGAPIVAVRLRSTMNQSPFDLLAVREIILEWAGKSTLKEITPVERLRLPVIAPK